MLAAEKESARELRRLRTAQAAVDADTAAAGAPAVGGVMLVRRVFDQCGPDYLKAFVERLVDRARKDRHWRRTGERNRSSGSSRTLSVSAWSSPRA